MPISDQDDLLQKFERLRPADLFSSLRYVKDTRETLLVRGGQEWPVYHAVDEGIMVTVVQQSGCGYAATSDLSHDGIYHAFTLAQQWARRGTGRDVTPYGDVLRPRTRGEYRTDVKIPWESTSRGEKYRMLRDFSSRMHKCAGVVDSQVMLSRLDTDSLLMTSEGSEIRQEIRRVFPHLSVTVSDGRANQTRTFARLSGTQAGLEAIGEQELAAMSERLPVEAAELLAAPECPAGVFDVVLGPAQMIFQIHETIGHPLELDRILGDERNYAGGSFLRRDDFGTLRYGSKHLNVVFDPAARGALASYAFDDEGTPAERAYLIRGGLLLRGIGGVLSQMRLGVAGVAAARASGWNRPPIDRMGNIHMEPGAYSLDELIGAVKRGIYLDDNCSWSIDDQRLKFQFGCEWGQMIEDGRLTHKVRNPCYRGVTNRFWQSLERVGDATTYRQMSTPNCGKGEPNQMLTAGHGSPACLFRGVDVFASGSAQGG